MWSATGSQNGRPLSLGLSRFLCGTGRSRCTRMHKPDIQKPAPHGLTCTDAPPTRLSCCFCSCCCCSCCCGRIGAAGVGGGSQGMTLRPHERGMGAFGTRSCTTSSSACTLTLRRISALVSLLYCVTIWVVGQVGGWAHGAHLVCCQMYGRRCMCNMGFLSIPYSQVVHQWFGSVAC